MYKTSNWSLLGLSLGQPLYVAALVVTPIIARKYTSFAGLPCSCAAFTAPIATVGLLWLQGLYGLKRSFQAVGLGGLAILLLASGLWLTQALPRAGESILPQDAWESIFTPLPYIALQWGVLYLLVQYASVYIAKQLPNSSTALTALLVSGLVSGLAYGLWVLLPAPYASALVGRELMMGTLGGYLATSSILGVIGYGVEQLITLPKSDTDTEPTGVYQLLCYFFWVLLLLTNLVTVRWVKLCGYLCTAGVVTYPLTFVITDLISEVYGKRKAQYAVGGGFVTSIGMMVLLALVGYLPLHSTSPISGPAFVRTFGFTPAIVVASMVAYLVAQLTDIYLFDLLRSYTKGRHLWLRNNVATLVSELLDTCCFALLTWGIWPLIAPAQIGSIVIAWQVAYRLALHEYYIKVIFALLDTPFVYLLVKVIKRWGIQKEDAGARYTITK